MQLSSAENVDFEVKAKAFSAHIEFFKKYGFNRTVMALVGFIELFGAVALWFPNYLGIAGILALLGTSAGAIFCHLYFDTWKDGIPAMVTLTFSIVVVYAKIGGLVV